MNKLYAIIAAIGFFLLLVFNSIYVVDQRESALVLQFGEAVSATNTPGLKFKVPFIQQVLYFDKRIQNLNADTSEVIAADQKQMRVDAFAKFKITNVLKFYQSAQNELKFKTRLDTILDSSLRQVLGSRPFKALLSEERSDLMVKISDIVNTEASGFGVEVVDVRIKRADLPDKSREAVFRRMSTEREKEAKEIRAFGAEEAQKVRAEADKNKIVLLATAKKKAQIIKGDGDSLAIKSFAKAFNKDPEFFDFYRSLEAYKKSISKDDTSIVLSPESDFMKYFKTRRVLRSQ